MSSKPIALDAYEALAEAYAAAVDTKPHNAYCERPATLSLIPDVKGKRVLDAGCGPGVYSEWLIKHGAKVVAIDVSPKMVGLAKQRLGETADVREADLREPITFLDSETFDVVLSPLVLDYMEDWIGPLKEYCRVLRQEGYFICSMGHPLFDYTYFKSKNYFETELVGAVWTGFPHIQVYMPTFRRALGEVLNPIIEAGFTIERIIEPKPTQEFKKADPKHYEELSQQPCFLCIRAKKLK